MEGCIFCALANGEIPTNTVYEDEEFRVILDANPANIGHSLVLPKKHGENIFELDAQTVGKAHALAKKVAEAQKKVLNCDGVNILQNNGEASGQTVMHYHVHVIPRYKGDKVGLGAFGQCVELDKEETQKYLEKLSKAVSENE